MNESLLAQLKTLETQIAVLRAQIRSSGAPTAAKAFADLYGVFAGQAHSTEEAIDAVQYGFDWQGVEEK
jgi:hypothetical protein